MQQFNYFVLFTHMGRVIIIKLIISICISYNNCNTFLAGDHNYINMKVISNKFEMHLCIFWTAEVI